ncbi:hypothetical protein NQ317_010432 [Molorchus minor]|uniref:Serpin domain-containing protein n=1 Tax=Molorchus minor TaxID=1323400 RepID=A0ABQ9JY80_9CUCU|nr:hypothetical protein NQ317_010432 [Molorchus minor]
MTILAEGSLDNTARQLESTLKLPQNKAMLRSSFQNYSDIIQRKADGVRLNVNTAIFTNQDFPVKKSFQAISEQSYKVQTTPINFRDPTQATSLINKYVAQATMNRIATFVTPAFYISRANGKCPLTLLERAKKVFYDDKNMKIGEVDMMFQMAPFPYSRLENINAYAVELPYGLDRKTSMIVILPFKGESLAGVLNLMSKVPFSSIVQSLEDSEMEYVDEDILVYLPKFKISSDFNLNIVLSKIGIKDIFDYEKANLLGMFDHYLYLSRLIQKAEIEVNEEGTVAAAASGAAIQNKSTPPVFKANRPFLYFIVDKPTRSIVFAGKVTNPDNLK